MMTYPYDRAYFKIQAEGSSRSAREIVPAVVDLIAPKRIVDVGCGTGVWLSAFLEAGVPHILGIDGAYVDKSQLRIPQQSFFAHNLTEPLLLSEQFDLVVSLEVAEHLPIQSASTYIDSLVRLGPIILFSAAIPLQPGTDHVNPQWPDYWVNLFMQRGFDVVDCLRKEFWHNKNVEYWYAQNTLLFVRTDSIANYPRLQAARSNTSLSQLSVVHPSLLRWYGQLVEDMSLDKRSTRELMSKLPRAVTKTARYHGRVLYGKIVRRRGCG